MKTGLDSAAPAPVAEARPSLRRIHREVLAFLAERYPAEAFGYEIENELNASHGTVSAAVRYLVSCGLVEKPWGERSGCKLTERGAAYAAGRFPELAPNLLA